MEYLKVSDRLKTTVDRLIAGGHNARNTFKKLFIGISVCVILAIVFNISKYLLAPNYSFLLKEIIPRLVHK